MRDTSKKLRFAGVSIAGVINVRVDISTRGS
jgi:hypothetical protein